MCARCLSWILCLLFVSSLGKLLPSFDPKIFSMLKDDDQPQNHFFFFFPIIYPRFEFYFYFYFIHVFLGRLLSF